MRSFLRASLYACLSLAVAGASFSQTLPPGPETGGSPGIAAPKLDALLLYRQGRDLETAGRTAEARARYFESIAVCEGELQKDPRRMEAFVVKCWSLFRLDRHQEVIDVGTAALKVQFDPRISEVMGESWFFLGKSDLALKSFARYLETAGENADRVPTAYFYMGETYLRLKKYAHADIAYSTAVIREPNMPRWWYRLGQTCESLGEWKRAFDAYGKALALSPSLAEAKDGRERVRAKAGM